MKTEEDITLDDRQNDKEPRHDDNDEDDGEGGGQRGDQYSLRVKPEFILDHRASSLPAIHEMYVMETTTTTSSSRTNQRNPEKNPDDSDNCNGSNNNKTTKKKNPNQATKKKRPRDVHVDNNAKFCSYLVRGEPCPFEGTCRFSHNIQLVLADRPADIAVEAFHGICPIYDTFGYCSYGLNCRFGACHVNMSTGINLSRNNIVVEPDRTAGNNLGETTRTETAAPTNILPTVWNTVEKSVLMDLRKRKYTFKCQRGQNLFQMAKQQQNADGGVKDTPPVPDLSLVENAAGTEPVSSSSSLVINRATVSNNNKTFDPLPSKTRKLIDFSNKVYVAPLTTVGNLPFRRVMKKFGADITCGEMAVASCLLEGKASEWALLKRHPEEDIFGVQIAAGHPDQFARTGELIETHICADFVDLNLGCPLDLICNKGAGASLMRRDGKLRDSLHSLSYALRKIPFTVKMRTGWDEKKPFAHLLVQKIQNYNVDGLAAIMVHGRSRLQRYSKDADWDYIAQVAQDQKRDDIAAVATIPIIGNGDIMSYSDYETKVLGHDQLVPCAMLGRGALIKPWLPMEIKERRQWDISSSERFDILKDFVRYGLEQWGSDQQGVNNCRRFLLEWLSFLHRYVPVGILEQVTPQRMNQRPPKFFMGRNDLETLFLSDHCSDWVKISEMLLGPVPEGFRFEPKHKGRAYKSEG